MGTWNDDQISEGSSVLLDLLRTMTDSNVPVSLVILGTALATLLGGMSKDAEHLEQGVKLAKEMLTQKSEKFYLLGLKAKPGTMMQ